jgi:hypothetical protein
VFEGARLKAFESLEPAADNGLRVPGSQQNNSGSSTGLGRCLVMGYGLAVSADSDYFAFRSDSSKLSM